MILSRTCECDYRRGMNCVLDLLNTCIHHSELQLITAPLLISTIHRSPQHLLSLFAARCVFKSHSIATASNSEDFSASRSHVTTVRRISRNWILLNCQLNYSAISSETPLQSSTQLQNPNWRPFHTNLLLSSSQADFQLTTELDCPNCLLFNSSAWTT
jgi:hypothetical protein